MAKLEKFLLGTMLVGGLTFGASSCSSKNKESKDQEEPKTEASAEVKVSDYATISEYNEALFESCRSDIVFALFFVENCYQYVYNDGTDHWTVADGLTKLYNEDGKTFVEVDKNTKPLTKEEAEVYTTRFLRYEILPVIVSKINTPMDKNSMISTCTFGYCIGASGLRNSNFLKYLNAGKKPADLARALSGYRKQQGLLNRWYFFAALLNGKIQYSDLLDLRAEGCYNLKTYEIVVCEKDKKGNYKKRRNPRTGKLEYIPVADKDGFCTWIFSDLDKKLQQAKNVRPVKLNLGDKKTVTVDCQLVKDIVPDYVWQDVSGNDKKIKKETHCVEDTYFVLFEQIRQQYSCNVQNDTSYTAYLNGDYDKALKAGKSALKLAETNKQKGAANYNIGISYMELGKYNKAVHYLEQSLAHNETPAGKTALETAKQKQSERSEKRGKTAKGILIGAGIAGAAVYGRKKYLAYNQRQR